MQHTSRRPRGTASRLRRPACVPRPPR